MNALLEYLPTIRKAIVAGLVPVLLGLLASLWNITPDMSVGDAVGLIAGGIITGVATWFAPNARLKSLK